MNDKQPLHIIIKSGIVGTGGAGPIRFYAAQLCDDAVASSEDKLHGEACMNITEAIGSLVRAHPERFNVVIKHSGSDQ